MGPIGKLGKTRGGRKDDGWAKEKTKRATVGENEKRRRKSKRQEIKKPRSVNFAVNRGDTIRTCDLYVPNVAL